MLSEKIGEVERGTNVGIERVFDVFSLSEFTCMLEEQNAIEIVLLLQIHGITFVDRILVSRVLGFE
jgi:hypothetical protein